MATYRYNYLLNQTPAYGASGQFPVAPYGINDTYQYNVSAVFKQGDVLEVKVIQGSGASQYTRYVGTAGGSTPDPTSPSSANSNSTSTHANNTVFSVTWGNSLASDAVTVWYFASGNANTGQELYSGRFYFKKVAAQLSVSANSNPSRGSLTFTSNNATLGGSGGDAFVQTGTRQNRLYVSIFNSSNVVVPQGTNGVTWDDNRGFSWGQVGSIDDNVVATFGSGLADGTYTAYLTHLNTAAEVNGSTNTGHDFYGATQRLGSGVTFTLGAVADSTPNAFNFGANITATALSQIKLSPVVTISGINATTSVNVTNAAYRINGGNFVTGTSTITNGQTIQLRVTGSGSYATNVDSVVTIGGVVGTNTTDNNNYWRVTTPAAASTDTTPDAFQSQLSSTPYSNRSLNQTVESDIVTMAGTNAASTVAVSGTAAAWRSRANSGGSFTAYSASSGTIPAGHQFQFKFNAHAANSTTSTATINVGGITGTITATTVAAAGGGGGGAGTGNYGLEVRNASGLVTFTPSARTTNFVASGTGSLAANAETTALPAEGMTSNNATDMAILVEIPGVSSFAAANSNTVTRLTDSFKIKNNTGSAIAFTYTVVRF